MSNLCKCNEDKESICVCRDCIQHTCERCNCRECNNSVQKHKEYCSCYREE